MRERAFIQKWLFYGDIRRVASICGRSENTLRCSLAPKARRCSRRVLEAALSVAKENEVEATKLRKLFVSCGMVSAEMRFVAQVIGVSERAVYDTLIKKNSERRKVSALTAYFEGRAAAGMSSKDARLLFRSGWEGKWLKEKILSEIKNI